MATVELVSAIDILGVVRRPELVQAMLSTNIFEDTTSGLASGLEYFSVPSAEAAEYLVLYHNKSGAAAVVDTYPNVAGITNARDAAEAFAVDVLSVAQEVSADRLASQQAADVAQLSAGVYSSTAQGLAATAVDRYFSVPSVDSNEYLILYENVAGVALEIKRYPSSGVIADLESRTTKYDKVLPSLTPIVTNDSGQIVLWLEDGLLAGIGLAPALLSGISVVVPQNPITLAMTPVAYSGTDVVLWLEEGKLGASGLSTDLLEQIAASLLASLPAAQPAAPPVSAKKSPVPIATDGSTLFRWRAKLADIRYGVSGAKVKVGMTGDSWVETPRIPNAMRALLESVIPNGGEGFQSLSVGGHLNGVVTAYTGFTLVDGGQVDIGATPVGPDGMSLTTTAANATFSMTKCRFTDLNIYYHDNGAAFRYRIDGGAWVSVVGASTNAMTYVAITGQTDVIHNLEIDSTGNTAALYLLGLYTTRSVGGVELSRIGNSGAYSTYIDKWVGRIQPFAATMNLDVLFVILGTNDQRFETSPPSKYIEVLQKLVNGYRAATPDIGIVLIIPAITAPTTIVNPLYLYRDALYKFCLENRCEFFNMHDFFGTFEQSNALGQFADTLHPNERGALNLVHELNNQFLKIK